MLNSVDASGLDSGEVVSSYKALAQVERAFRAFNTNLDIRPIRHRTETRVRAHVFLRMLSYYITWHMQARLAPILFTDNNKPARRSRRPSPVAPPPAPRALAKAAAKSTPGDLPVHGFDSLLHRPGHHLPQPDPARPSPPCRPSSSSPPPHRSSGKPSTCSASATSGSRSRSLPRTTTKPRVNGGRPDH